MKNNVILKSKKELENFLKKISRESVEKTIYESDMNIEKYRQQKKSDQKIFKTLKEENDDQDTGDEPVMSGVNQDDITDNTNDVDEEVLDNITPRMVISKINNIRAGLSLKNKEIKENLISFLEKLDENEILVLFYYLEDISKILNQKIRGQDAIDPSEDPLNISMTRKSEKDIEAKPTPSTPKKQIQSNQKEVEDTSPPIKVNEVQDKSEIRKKIRTLLS